MLGSAHSFVDFKRGCESRDVELRESNVGELSGVIVRAAHPLGIKSLVSMAMADLCDPPRQGYI